MATIKLYFDGRRLVNGFGQLKVVFRNANTTSQTNLGFSIPDGAWDEASMKVRSHPKLIGRPAVLTKQIQERFSQIQYAFTQVCGVRCNLPAKRIAELTFSYIKGDKGTEGQEMMFLDLWDSYVDNRVDPRSHKVYNNVKSWIIRNRQDVAKKCVSEIESETVADIYASMRDTLGINSSASYIGCVVAVMNYARKKKLSSVDPSEFLDVDHSTTKSRALTIDQLRYLWNYENTDEYRKRSDFGRKRARGAIALFKMSFALCGLNLQDIYRLDDDDIKGHRLQTNRSKTGIRIDCEIQPEVREAWPIVKKMITGKTQININKKANYMLDGIIKGVTLYWARHTWATIANRLDIPNETIALGLAHSYGGITNQVYVQKSYDKLDKANRMILDYVQEIGEFEKDGQ